MRPRFSLPVILLLLLGACASDPAFDTGGVDRSLTPRSIAAGPEPATGTHVLWGGVILGITNLEDRTQIEVLAYPLDTDARPQRNLEPLGPFILEQTGYLEPATYVEGRQITVVGTVSGTRPEKSGELDYDYPVITARQITLWPRISMRDGTSVIFSIGAGTGH